MRHYFAILTLLVLGFCVQLSLSQAEEEKAKTVSREPIKTQTLNTKTQEGRTEKSETIPNKTEESRKQQLDRDRSRGDWRGAIERFRNASPEERRKMRGKLGQLLKSRRSKMERWKNGRRRPIDSQQREREMEIEKREREHQFQLERMQKEHEMEMERLEQKRLREMREHEIPHLDFEFELPEDKISDEQRTKTRLIRFRLEQQTIQKMAEIRIQQFEVQIALQQQFYSQQINPEQLKADIKSIEELIKTISTRQSEIKILPIQAMVEVKSLLNPEQLKYLINQSKENH